MIIGLILNYAFPPGNSPLFDLACSEYECGESVSGSCADVSSFQIGEDIQLRSMGANRCGKDENVVIAEVLGKVFKDKEGNYIEQTVSSVNKCLLDATAFGVYACTCAPTII